MPIAFDLRPRALVGALIGYVLKAGAAEMQHYRNGFEVVTKADNSPVTAADRDAEAILLDGLAKIAPGVPVVAEESASEGRTPAIGDTFFLVDPLDGTKEFINKRGEFTVNVALIVDGRPTAGIVYAPAIEELYATVGEHEAAFAKIAPEATPGSLEDCRLTPIHTRKPNLAALGAVASRSHNTPASEALLGRYNIAERSDSGSSLKFCVIARGAADLYPRLAPTMEWDIAAGHAVLAAAGGSVTLSDGRPLRYGKASAGFKNSEFVAWGTPEPIKPAR